MTAIYVTRLTTKTADVYPTIEAWVAAHGNAGTRRPLLINAKLELEADGKSVIRTLEFPTEADFHASREAVNVEIESEGKTAEDRLYTVEKISKTGL